MDPPPSNQKTSSREDGGAPGSADTPQTHGVVNAPQSTITAQTHGVVNAPQIAHSHIEGAVTFNMVTHMHNTGSAREEDLDRAPGAIKGGEDASVHKVSSKIKSNLKMKFENIFEGLAKRGNPTLLNRMFTEVYITEGEREVIGDDNYWQMMHGERPSGFSGEGGDLVFYYQNGGMRSLNKAWIDQSYYQMVPKGRQCEDLKRSFNTAKENLSEHEVWQLNTASRHQTCHEPAINCNDIFKPLPGQDVHIRTVLTKGVAGIGKTVSVQKFILDWSEEKANQDVDFIFVLPFRELNRYQNDKLSLHELLEIFHPELKDVKDMKMYDEAKMLFIFDGLDESYLPLSFQRNRFIADVAKRSSLDKLLINLFKGNLLPSAHIWITSRPAAVHRIRSDCLHRVTEMHGFNDQQKEEYFRNRVSDERQADTIISHLRASKSLHTMCHIPVFCWIASTVLGGMGSDTIGGNISYTLTSMYTRFLLIQTNVKNQKYYDKDEQDSRELSSSDVQILLQIGKLAFENLEKSKLVFSERDLKRYGLNTVEISVHSGLFTEILKKEDPMFEGQWYSFVHLSIQEFLAAVFVFLSFVRERLDVPHLNAKGASCQNSSFDKNWLRDSMQPCKKSGKSPFTHEQYLSYVLDDSDCDSEDEPLKKPDIQDQMQQQHSTHPKTSPHYMSGTGLLWTSP